MECGHAFCNDCWQQHCRIQISEGRSRQLACMAAGCGAICDECKVCCAQAPPHVAPATQHCHITSSRVAFES